MPFGPGATGAIEPAITYYRPDTDRLVVCGFADDSTFMQAVDRSSPNGVFHFQERSYDITHSGAMASTTVRAHDAASGSLVEVLSDTLLPHEWDEWPGGIPREAVVDRLLDEEMNRHLRLNQTHQKEISVLLADLEPWMIISEAEVESFYQPPVPGGRTA